MSPTRSGSACPTRWPSYPSSGSQRGKRRLRSSWRREVSALADDQDEGPHRDEDPDRQHEEKRILMASLLRGHGLSALPRLTIFKPGQHSGKHFFSVHDSPSPHRTASAGASRSIQHSA